MSANSNGFGLEDIVKGILERNGFELIEDGAWLLKHRRDPMLKGKKYYSREVTVGESAVKGKMRRVEFFTVYQDAYPDGHLYECKWQEVGGSTEDKLLKLPLDIKKTGIPTTVILDGGGFSPGIIAHLKSHVDGRTFCAVLSIVEFMIAVNRGVLGSGVIKPMLLRRKEPPQQQALWGDA